MAAEATLQKYLEITFKDLQSKKALRSLPAPRTLAKELENAFDKGNGGSISVSPKLAQCFATASIDMWHRSIHSFLVSAALTKTSPIWASVSGYYSSHYSIRALAHLLGHFQLFHKRKIVSLNLENGNYNYVFINKKAGDREHRIYWKLVKQYADFKTDPLFTDNESNKNHSDIDHRDYANYIDHLPYYNTFNVIDLEAMKARIEQISKIVFSVPPIPDTDEFPDIESVQVVAYHRLVKFRRFLDETLSTKNRFWNMHRNPSWATDYINFQLVEQAGFTAIGG